MERVDRSYIGKGNIYLKLRGGNTGFLHFGNCSALGVSFEEDKKQQKDYTKAGGGNTNSVSTISNVVGTVTALDLTAETLAPALGAAVSKIAGGTQVTDEVLPATGTTGEFIPFNSIPDKTQTITIKDGLDDSVLVEGTDYELTDNGLLVLEGSAIDTDGVKASYTKSAAEVLEALVEAGQEFSLYFDGLNEAQSGKPVNIRIHRLKFSPVTGLALIGDEFAEMEMEFEILSDGAISGAGISKFMKVAQAL
ncbi:phage tail tube protein [Sansalvadorimonas verongulae]|uniref:phage tail tube protein n=1 Tax=Sansalvadorimonas verongulae TaxID=2172824 RepID=UPI0012BBBFDD|nr:hypothetical protein [Sansalvadorimonas verongulae]MTI11660.1 hypothetical protein [Sansalvadorimonas verongulae]